MKNQIRFGKIDQTCSLESPIRLLRGRWWIGKGKGPQLKTTAGV